MPSRAAVFSVSQWSAGTLPPRFTEKTHRHHHYHHTPSLYSSSRPPTMAINSEATAPRARTTITTNIMGGVSTLLSPHNNGLRSQSNTTVRASDNLITRKRPRTSPYPYVRHGTDAPNTSCTSPESRPMTPAFTNAVPGRKYIKDGTDKGSGGSLWGSTGGPPTGVADPNKNGTPLETEWACPSSSGATSTPSLHDGFSDVGFLDRRCPS